MKIYNIFRSIVGEVNAFGQGTLSTFIRFAGCNLEQAEGLQHLGYTAYLNWLEQMDATEYYYRNLMNRSI